MEILKDKGAVVTGAASGIGRAIGRAFVDAGAHVLLCDVNYRAVEAIACTLGDRTIGRLTDVSDERQVERVLRAAREAFASLDIVVNCGGSGAIAPLTGLTGENWGSVQAVTLDGAFYCVKHGARQMLERERPGVIINISPVKGRQPGKGQAACCAAKAGVDMLTRCGALELGSHRIRVVTRAVSAEKIAAAVVFLASDHARSINGETIAIDGAALRSATRRC